MPYISSILLNYVLNYLNHALHFLNSAQFSSIVLWVGSGQWGGGGGLQPPNHPAAQPPSHLVT